MRADSTSAEVRAAALGVRGFYEFFSGGGMARAGLGEAWSCLFANDFDPRKGEIYRRNFPGETVLRVGDIHQIRGADLPGRADLVWGSFPCQDLSLAGGGAGLGGERSGAFHPFWRIVTDLVAEGRAPKIVAIENVLGALTSRGGRDFAAICARFAQADYRYGALAMDAADFLPQSRPRLFIIGVRADITIDPCLVSPSPHGPFHPPALRRAFTGVDEASLRQRVWWSLPCPPKRRVTLEDIVEETPTGVRWHSDAERDQLVSMMSPAHQAKLEAARRCGRRMVGTAYRRTRPDETGAPRQRAEVRFDGLAGCLRTPAGGSSRQLIIVVDGERVRSRLISARETARLMGLADDYILPTNYNEAYHLTGDGVAAPVVRHLAEHLLEPLTLAGEPARAAA